MGDTLGYGGDMLEIYWGHIRIIDKKMEATTYRPEAETYVLDPNSEPVGWV